MIRPEVPGGSSVARWGAAALGTILALAGLARAGADPDPNDAIAKGRDLFLREWFPGEGTRPGGDGLGPVYNDTSCVACHGLGGPGGAGPSNKNAEILTAVRSGLTAVVRQLDEQARALQAAEAKSKPAEKLELQARKGEPAPKRPGTTDGPAATEASRESKQDTQLTRVQPVKPDLETHEGPNLEISPDGLTRVQPVKPDLEKLAELHPAFRSARSITLHLFSTDPNYPAWRARLLGLNNQGKPAQGKGPVATEKDRTSADVLAIRQQVASRPANKLPRVQHGAFTLVLSRRNPPALFGAGLIDAIPESVIEEGLRKTFPEFPEIQGRVNRLPDGSIGRFGWKAQTASLKEFVLTACAVELGLEVPDHPQGKLPQVPQRQGLKPGLDLDAAECDALIAFVRNLAPPTQRRPSSPRQAQTVQEGRKRFEEAGCATCHTPKLGKVDRVFSDLLLHDMGPELADNGVYGGDSSDPEADPPAAMSAVPGRAQGGAAVAVKGRRGASRQEWRTPPLWGFRDTAPYLHDGRAATLEEAVAFHGGQAARSAEKFFQLPPEQRRAVEIFLKSLTAPAATELAQAH
ncbi:MAG TPA: di-heme oxidoredictase family protein [Isosphaeraceae bacterium]|nr:di-heme oxidoredictase family protein [Isosphaeraceae bacterium]